MNTFNDVVVKLNHLKTYESIYCGDSDEEEQEIIKFVPCPPNDDSLLDPDMNYSLKTKTITQD